MTFHINPDRFENNNVEVSTDADGNTVITDKGSGESVSLGATGFSADSASVTNDVTAGSVQTPGVQTGDLGTERNAREYMLENGYSNIAPAINALIDDILAEQVGGGKIVIPHPRSGDPGIIGNDWLLSETISVPYHFSRETRIALVGAGMGAVTLRPDFATAAPAIQKEPAGTNADGSSQDAGFMVQGLSIRDVNGVATKIIDINDILHGTVRDCTLQGSTVTNEVIHCHGPNEGAFFSLIDNCRISKMDGTTGIRLGDEADALGANASTVRHCEMTGAVGTSIGIDIDFAGSSNIIGGNTDNAGTAIKITKNGVGVWGHRFEAPYGETNSNANIVTPVEITDGAEGCVISPNVRHGITNSPNDPPRDLVKASKWGGQYNTFDMGAVTRWAVDHGGGAAGQDHWIYDGSLGSSTPSRNLGQIKLTTAATAGDDVRYFAQNLATGSQLSRLDFSANLAHTLDHVTIMGWQNDVNNRGVFIADPNDTLATGITNYWIARTIDGGTVIGTTNTGVSIDTSIRVFSIVPEKEGTPYRWRYLIDGTTVATHEDATLGGDIGWAGPNAEIETKAASSKTLRVRSIVPRILGAGGAQKL